MSYKRRFHGKFQGLGVNCKLHLVAKSVDRSRVGPRWRSSLEEEIGRHRIEDARKRAGHLCTVPPRQQRRPATLHFPNNMRSKDDRHTASFTPPFLLPVVAAQEVQEIPQSNQTTRSTASTQDTRRLDIAFFSRAWVIPGPKAGRVAREGYQSGEKGPRSRRGGAGAVLV